MFAAYVRYQIVTKLFLSLVAFPLLGALNKALLASAGMNMLTSSDFFRYFTSPQGVATIVLCTIFSAIVTGIDLFAFIHISDAYRHHGCILSIRQALLAGIKSTRAYASLSGVLVLFYIVVLMPILGIGVRTASTERLVIPAFIESAIEASTLYSALLLFSFIALAYLGLRYIFVLHEVVISDLPMRQALRASRSLTKKRAFRVLWRTLKKELLYALAWVGILTIVGVVYVLGLVGLGSAGWLNMEGGVLSVTLYVVEGVLFATLLFTPWMMDILTRVRDGLLQEGAARGESTESIENAGTAVPATDETISRNVLSAVPSAVPSAAGLSAEPTVSAPKRARKTAGKSAVMPTMRQGIAAAVIVCALFALNSLFSYVVVNNPTDFIMMRNTRVIAHRAGGDLAPENTVEGVKAAIQAGAWGTEIDVQRTKDGAYILNHDGTFARVAGVKKSAQEMTLEQIRQLTVHNNLLDDPIAAERLTAKKGELIVADARVPTIEEFLDAAQGNIHVYLELKGKSADHKMADDMVALIRARHMEKEVSLLSLDYELISYINDTYPDITTGFLYYYSFGDMSKAKTNFLVMEEGMANEDNLDSIHASGREAVVWTVNSQESMDRFAYSSVDGIISDYPMEVIDAVQSAQHASTFDKLIGSLVVLLS